MNLFLLIHFSDLPLDHHPDLVGTMTLSLTMMSAEFGFPELSTQTKSQVIHWTECCTDSEDLHSLVEYL